MFSIFNKWNPKKPPKLKVPVSLAPLKWDMHSHLLPGIDDGAQNIEQSIELIEKLIAFGYEGAVTTPHVYWDMYRNTPEIILEKLALVRAEIAKRQIPFTLNAAAEYFCDEHFEAQIEQNQLLHFGAAKYVLFEISFVQENINLGRAIFNMRLNGYQPILAHPERYEYWHTDFSRYENMLDKEVLLQVNINSLTGQYGPNVRRTAEKLIERGMVSFIGTDCHHLGHIDLMEQARSSPSIQRFLASSQSLHATIA